jgi:hypothetical protein
LVSDSRAPKFKSQHNSNTLNLKKLGPSTKFSDVEISSASRDSLDAPLPKVEKAVEKEN